MLRSLDYRVLAQCPEMWSKQAPRRTVDEFCTAYLAVLNFSLLDIRHTFNTRLLRRCYFGQLSNMKPRQNKFALSTTETRSCKSYEILISSLGTFMSAYGDRNPALIAQ